MEAAWAVEVSVTSSQATQDTYQKTHTFTYIPTERLTCGAEPRRSVCCGIALHLPVCRYWGSCTGWQRPALVRCMSVENTKELRVSMSAHATVLCNPHSSEKSWDLHESPHWLRICLLLMVPRKVVKIPTFSKVVLPSDISVGNAVPGGVHCNERGSNALRLVWSERRITNGQRSEWHEQNARTVSPAQVGPRLILRGVSSGIFAWSHRQAVCGWVCVRARARLNVAIDLSTKQNVFKNYPITSIIIRVFLDIYVFM
jgi:hypothetical protein